MCKHCKQNREFVIELTTIHGNDHNRTGCDLHDRSPSFTYCGEPQLFERHAVNYHWMEQQLHSGASNKMLYHLCSCEHTELFGAVYDSFAYLYVVKLAAAAEKRAVNHASDLESLAAGLREALAVLNYSDTSGPERDGHWSYERMRELEQLLEKPAAVSRT